MKRAIQRIQHYTVSHYTLTLACGHTRTVTKAQLDAEQLFIGKRMECAQCPGETA